MLEKKEFLVERKGFIFKLTISKAKQYFFSAFCILFILISLFLISCYNSQKSYFFLWKKIGDKIEDDLRKSFFLTSLATIFAKKGEVDKALETVDLIENDWFKESAFFTISKQFSESAKFELAIELTDQITDNSIKAMSLSEIAIGYAANEQFDKAISLAKSIDALYYKSLAMSEIALKEFEQGDTTMALELLDYALKMADEIKDNDKKRKLLTMIAVRYAIMQKYDTATKMVNSFNIQSNKIGCLIGLSKVFADHKEHEKANEQLEKAFNLLVNEERSKKIDIGLYLEKIADIYIKIGEYNNALELTGNMKSISKRARVFTKISIAYEKNGEQAKAEELLSKALNLASNEMYGLSKVIVYSTIFNEYIDNDQNDMGMEYLEIAVRATKSFDVKAELTMAFYLIAQGYVKLNNFTEALRIANLEDVSLSDKLMIIALVAEKHVETGIPISRNENNILADIVEKLNN